MLIQHTPYLVPRNTSQLVVAPGYEKPLLQLRYNTGQADRSLWVQQLKEFPAGVPEAGKARELLCEAEMQRLAATYGTKNFRVVYPLDELFERAFASCGIAALPGQENAVPDLQQSSSVLVDEFVELNVPTLDRDKAQKLVDAGYQVLTLPTFDIGTIKAATGLPDNLIKSVTEAAKQITSAVAPRRAPSAPSEMRVTSLEASGLS